MFFTVLGTKHFGLEFYYYVVSFKVLLISIKFISDDQRMLLLTYFMSFYCPFLLLMSYFYKYKGTFENY